MKHLLPLFSLCALILAGCGYKAGSLMHPQIKTVAVAPVVNETLTYNAAPQVRALLCERFQTEGSLKLVDEKKADCIVYARIVDFKYTQISWSNVVGNDELLPNEWGVSVTIEYSVMMPGRAAPLVRKRKVTGNTTFMSGPDLEVSRTNAIRQAAFDAAKKIVANITEAW